MWFLNDLGRLQREREAVGALQEKQAWLDGVNWQLDSGGLIIDCEIMLEADAVFPIRLRFPDHYPSAVPAVRPREPERWSDHQYGAGGDLCLELGPDNWHPDFHLAANMLESAHQLLLLESEHEQDESLEIPSRHSVTDGQRQRAAVFRFVITPAVLAALDSIPDAATSRCRIDLMYHESVITAFLARLEMPTAEDWTDPDLPQDLKRHGSSATGVVVTEKLGALQIAELLEPETFQGLLSRQMIPAPKDAEADTSTDNIQFIATRGLNQQWQLFWRWRSGKKVTAFMTLTADTSSASLRLGVEHGILANKSVAIVGVGSVGSKIATSLARSGVGNFVLVDDDLLQPSNLVRHDSDWLHVGQHKVDAVADRLKFINSSVKITRRKHRLGGQEAPTSAASALTALGKADVIIDATANPKVFSLCAHVARQSQTPMLWLEIYAGGIGGLIARARPSKDAEPFTLREAIHESTGAIATAKGVDPPESIARYTAAGPDEQILIASDADVSVIAASTTQIALDTLLEREPSAYPYPAYLIGLVRSWIFEQPFHVLPITCTADCNWSNLVQTDDATYNEGAQFIRQLLEEATENAGN